MDSDTRRLLKAAEAQGFTWDLTTRNHPRVFAPNGDFVTTFSGTSGDVRGFRNGLAAMRRAGFIWPPPRRR